MPNVYIISCKDHSGEGLNTEFLVKIAHYPQIVRIGETSWLVYTDDPIQTVREHMALSPDNPCETTVDDLTTASDNPAWKETIVEMMRKLYSKHTWNNN